MKTIGLDFGTDSVRSVLVDVETGQEISSTVAEYEHGIIQGKYHDRFWAQLVTWLAKA